MTLTQEELDAIRARVEAATVGPWMVGSSEDVFGTNTTEYFAGTKINENGVYSPVTRDIHSGADADFIAAARQDVPKLLAEVERLRAELQRISNHTMSMYVNAGSMASTLKRIAREALDDGK